MVLELDRFIKPFLGIPYPSYDWCYAVADMEYEEIGKIKKRFNCPKTWDQVSKDDMQHYHEMLFFIPNDRDKLYYFPAYIKYLLEKPKELDGTGFDYTFFMVLKDIDPSILTDKQKEALIDLLSYIKKHNDTYEYADELLKDALQKLIYHHHPWRNHRHTP
ncbi:DUF6714 family protein [Nitratifractor sp.]|uniref:DUF6714 family protein n=1 Tax=Nitratifractor sp. TaxID=2268144 RepID=UPI002600992B|nr:DUF6714 family protein [Nitratifractor sp.]